jgi:hypothetical protein
MIHLDIERINEYAPYKVEAEAGQYIFETDHGILYGVSFDLTGGLSPCEVKTIRLWKQLSTEHLEGLPSA